jgi:hypothetical protein
MVQVLEEELVSSYWMMKIQSTSPVITSITAITSITCMALGMHPRLARPRPARCQLGRHPPAHLAVGCHAVCNAVSITCLSSWYDHQTYAWCSSD